MAGKNESKTEPASQGLLDFSKPVERPRLEVPVKPPNKEPEVYQVSDLISQAARLLEGRFPDVWVEGEIDSCKLHPPTGNLYFVLKDEKGRVDAMMPRSRVVRVRFQINPGLKVRVRGQVSLYKAQGRFQFYVEEMELTGEGALLRAFEELKAKLQREGLFAQERKRRLPPFPRRIGVVTSQSGAALQDILRVAARRGRVPILLSPCQVQGDGAPPQICTAIELLQGRVDVIIVGRGGGSSADLWAFNDEQVARTISRSKVPVVSAVGHEVDFTIADFVADVRAPTPSAAAEMVVPFFAHLEEELAELHKRLCLAGKRAINHARQRLDGELARGNAAISRQISRRRRTLSVGMERMQKLHPSVRLKGDRAALATLAQRLERLERGNLQKRRRIFEGLVGKLDAMSPLRVLLRGYAVVKDVRDHVVVDATTVAVGEPVEIRLAHGELTCEVLEVRPAEPKAEADADPEGALT